MLLLFLLVLLLLVFLCVFSRDSKMISIGTVEFRYYEHVYMRPKVNSNGFEISRQGKISL